MRSVSAMRPDVDRTGWQQMKISRRTSSSMWSGSTVPGSTVPVPLVSSSRAISSVLRSSVFSRRSRSIARCLAVAMSQAPGLSGTPDSGHCSSAATSASCARSSARPTSRTVRARPAISLGDSILQTASTARWMSGAAGTARLLVLARPRAQALLLLPELRSERLAEVVGLEDLADLDLGLRALGVGNALDPLDRLLLRLGLDQPEAGDQLLRLGERAVDHGALGARELDPRSLRARLEPLPREHHARVDELLVELPHLGEELLARQDAGLAVLGCLHQEHESHLGLLGLGSEPAFTYASNGKRRNRHGARARGPSAEPVRLSPRGRAPPRARRARTCGPRARRRSGRACSRSDCGPRARFPRGTSDAPRSRARAPPGTGRVASAAPSPRSRATWWWGRLTVARARTCRLSLSRSIDYE